MNYLITFITSFFEVISDPSYLSDKLLCRSRLREGLTSLAQPLYLVRINPRRKGYYVVVCMGNGHITELDIAWGREGAAANHFSSSMPPTPKRSEGGLDRVR